MNNQTNTELTENIENLETPIKTKSVKKLNSRRQSTIILSEEEKQILKEIEDCKIHKLKDFSNFLEKLTFEYEGRM